MKLVAEYFIYWWGFVAGAFTMAIYIKNDNALDVLIAFIIGLSILIIVQSFITSERLKKKKTEATP